MKLEVHVAPCGRLSEKNCWGWEGVSIHFIYINFLEGCGAVGWERVSDAGGTCRSNLVQFLSNEIRYPPSIASLTLVASRLVKTSQLSVLTVDPNMHKGALLTVFYCHFDHPQQYKKMLFLVKNGRLILTCKCTYMYYTWGLTVFDFLSALPKYINILTDFDSSIHTRDKETNQRD